MNLKTCLITQQREARIISLNRITRHGEKGVVYVVYVPSCLASFLTWPHNTVSEANNENNYYQAYGDLLRNCFQSSPL